MGIILKRECFKLAHSLKMFLVFVLFLLLIIYMYDISVGKPVLLIYAWKLPEEWMEQAHTAQTNREIMTLMQEVESQGEIAGWTDGYFWIEKNAMSLFLEGGALAEKWAEYDFPHTMEQKQYYSGCIGEPTQKEFGASKRFTDTLRDFSAGAYISMLAPAFFFGTDFINRSYRAGCFSGESRFKTFLGKYLFYLIAMTVLSLLGTLLPCLIYNREVLQLPFGYVLKGIGLHCAILVGDAALMSPFPFLFWDEWKTLAATFVVSYFLFSVNGAIIPLYPFRFVGGAFWETLSDGFVVGGILLMTAALVVIAGTVNAILFQRAELK